MTIAKPFLKWAGGKTQLLTQIENNLPKDFHQKEWTYMEPFVGSGAVLFWIIQKYPNITKVVINDINNQLVNVYKTIKENPDELIYLLNTYQTEFYKLKGIDSKKEYYYSQRTIFNSHVQEILIQSALFIFLNKTCFNGLFRVNKKGEFNVPIGSYDAPLIYDSSNILACSKVLSNIELLSGDYQKVLQHSTEKTLVYLDPPYKPLSKTSNFNSYAKDQFGDQEQIRLKNFCDDINSSGGNFILSNSDCGDNFFDDLYKDYNIERVKAKRSINVKGEKRGQINELLIKNF
jgi:DNA adenine methylase